MKRKNKEMKNCTACRFLCQFNNKSKLGSLVCDAINCPLDKDVVSASISALTRYEVAFHHNQLCFMMRRRLFLSSDEHRRAEEYGWSIWVCAPVFYVLCNTRWRLMMIWTSLFILLIKYLISHLPECCGGSAKQQCLVDNTFDRQEAERTSLSLH